MDPCNGSPLRDVEKARKFTGMSREANGGQDAPSTNLPQDKSGLRERGFSSDSPRAIPVPGPLLPSVQLPSSPYLSVQLLTPAPSFDEHCTPFQAPVADLGRYGHLAYGQIRVERRQRGYSRKASEAVSRTRLAAMDADGGKRRLSDVNDVDTLMSALAQRERPPADEAEYRIGS